MQNAIRKLRDVLVQQLGFQPESLVVHKANKSHADRIIILTPNLPDVDLEIAVSEIWHSLGTPHYYVTYRNNNGDFMCCSGTPSIHQTLFNLGGAMNMAQSAKPIKQPEPVISV